MPYFERKPWLETVQEVTKAGPPGDAMLTGEDEPGIGDIARDVLSAETGPQHALDGPYRCRETMSPGQSGSITLEVSADSAGGALTLDLSPGDLRSRSGAIIPANKIKVRPDHLAIAPGSNGRFVVDILVPLQSKPAIYTGRVIGSGPEPVSFQIEVEVGPPKA